MEIKEKAKLASKAAIELAALSSEVKNRALLEVAKELKNSSKSILTANKKDMKNSKKAGLNNALLKRLSIDNNKLEEMIEEVESVAKLSDPVGKTISQVELDDGLMLYQITCPIGVIGAIFESRPDVVSQISALCIKSGNSVILKGGSEAKNSNNAIADAINKALSKLNFPKGTVQLIETREEVAKMMKLSQYINLIIPRGSNSFVKYIQENTSIPVLGHSDGICHVYVDKSADLKKAIDICFDAKCQYPAVCNAMETMLVHKDIAKKFLPEMAKKFIEAKVELRADKKTKEIVKGLKAASEKDWDTEYNDLILSIKIVNDANEAISHINQHGSKHTESIVTEDKKNAEKFMSFVDAASVVWNASTRFADGFRYGKGAEVGISTAKIHARGPVGLEGLIIYKYRLIGNGHIVKTYSGPNAKKYKHRVIKRQF